MSRDCYNLGVERRAGAQREGAPELTQRGGVQRANPDDSATLNVKLHRTMVIEHAEPVGYARQRAEAGVGATSRRPPRRTASAS